MAVILFVTGCLLAAAGVILGFWCQVRSEVVQRWCGRVATVMVVVGYLTAAAGLAVGASEGRPIVRGATVGR